MEVLVKVEHASFKVLTTSNAVQTIELQRMGRKKSSKGIMWPPPLRWSWPSTSTRAACGSAASSSGSSASM